MATNFQIGDRVAWSEEYILRKPIRGRSRHTAKRGTIVNINPFYKQCPISVLWDGDHVPNSCSEVYIKHA